MSSARGHGGPRCRELFDKLSELLDGELDQAICAEIEGHLGDCPPCQRFLESLRRTVLLVQELPVPVLPEKIRRELVESVRRLREDRAH